MTPGQTICSSLFPCPAHVDAKITPNTCWHRQSRVKDMIRSAEKPLDPECIGCVKGEEIREAVESGEITLPGKIRGRGRGWANTRIRRAA